MAQLKKFYDNEANTSSHEVTFENVSHTPLKESVGVDSPSSVSWHLAQDSKCHGNAHTPEFTYSITSEPSLVLNGCDSSSPTHLQTTNTTNDELDHHVPDCSEESPIVASPSLNSSLTDLACAEPATITDLQILVVDDKSNSISLVDGGNRHFHGKAAATDDTDTVVVIDSDDSDDENLEKSEYWQVILQVIVKNSCSISRKVVLLQH